MGKLTIEQNLYEIASLQQGYFTSKQAKEAGYSDSRFAYHVRQGRWIREGRRIYRLANYPMGDRPDLVYWSLWSSNREGNALGVFSHQTALAIHDLSDLMPEKYHLTVPVGFRKYRIIPKALVLHFQNLQKDEIWEFEGYKVTSPIRTIRDVILHEGISDELVMEAITDGLHTGVISSAELERLADQLKSERFKRICNIIYPL